MAAKFRVTGSNRESGARMTLELTAASKGDAERKAAHAGMDVLHVAPIDERNQDHHTHQEESKRPMAKNYRSDEGSSQTKKLIIALVVLAVLALLVNFVILPMLG